LAGAPFFNVFQVGLEALGRHFLERKLGFIAGCGPAAAPAVPDSRDLFLRQLREYERGFMALGAPEGDTNTGLAYAGPVQWLMAGRCPFGGAYTDSFESGSRMQHRELLATQLMEAC